MGKLNVAFSKIESQCNPWCWHFPVPRKYDPIKEVIAMPIGTLLSYPF